MRHSWTWVLPAVIALGCTENRQPSATSQTPPKAAPEPVASAAPANVTPSAQPLPSASAAPAQPSAPPPPPSASASQKPEPASTTLKVELTGADGKLLPQNKDKPSTDDALFKARSRALWDAIVQDKPELAVEFFFPKIAYLDVKASQRPGRDWTHRLMAHFKRDIHKYHRKLGRNRDKLTFERIKVEPGRVQWIKPGREYNKIGYYRVTRSQIVFRNVQGNIAALELTSLISWRGHWYVVHLDGFQ